MPFTTLRPNQVILVIIFAVFVLNVASNLTIPFFAVFILKDIGAAAAAVGFVIATYWIIKSILQLPIARWLDRNHGEIDDYYALVIGNLITTAGVFLFYFASEAWHLFAIQAVIAVGDAFVVPPLYAIFTRHVDRNSEGFEWALLSSFSTGAGSAIGGALSGVLVSAIGIRPLFLVNGSLMLLGTIILIFLKPHIRPKVPFPAERIFIEHRRP